MQQMLQQRHRRKGSPPPEPKVQERRGISITGHMIPIWDALVEKHEGLSAPEILALYLPRPHGDAIQSHARILQRALEDSAQAGVTRELLEPVRVLLEAQQRAHLAMRTRRTDNLHSVVLDAVIKLRLGKELEVTCSDGACKGKPAPCDACSTVAGSGDDEPCAACREYFRVFGPPPSTKPRASRRSRRA